MRNEWNPEKYSIVQKEYQNKYGKDLILKLKQYCSLRNSNILDLGCGDGNLSIELSNTVGSSGSVIAIDLDTGMIDEAIKKFQHIANIKFHNSDILHWFSNDKKYYDIIFSNAVLHWIDSHKGLDDIISKTHDRLKEKGYFAFRFSLKGHAEKSKILLEKNLRIFTRESCLDIKRSIFTFKDCLNSIGKTGFKIIYSKELFFLPFEDEEMDYNWLIYSQPILRYIPKDKFNEFAQFLKSNWQKEKIKVDGYQAIFILQKG